MFKYMGSCGGNWREKIKGIFTLPGGVYYEE